MKEITTIYWSSSLRNPSPPEQWVLKDPEPVINYFLKNNISEDKDSIFGCPAARGFFKNLFVFRSNIDDTCVWPEGYLKEVVNNKIGPLDSFGNTIEISQVRKSAIDGYIDLVYNANFVMFADKPLTIRISSPSYPPSYPSDGAMFTSGEFDIGRWYRPGLLNWFVPLSSTTFKINKDDGLFYAQALTTNKIVFQKFMMTNEIRELAQSFRSIKQDGLTLEKRYQLAEGTKRQELILAEIKKNLITNPSDHNT